MMKRVVVGGILLVGIVALSIPGAFAKDDCPDGYKKWQTLGPGTGKTEKEAKDDLANIVKQNLANDLGQDCDKDCHDDDCDCKFHYEKSKVKCHEDTTSHQWECKQKFHPGCFCDLTKGDYVMRPAHGGKSVAVSHPAKKE